MTNRKAYMSMYCWERNKERERLKICKGCGIRDASPGMVTCSKCRADKAARRAAKKRGAA
jgi:hypothetical protein